MCPLHLTIFQVMKWRRMKWAGHVAFMRERRSLYGVLLEKPEEKRPLGRPRHRWEDNINPLNAELNPICHLLALLGGATIVVVSRLRVKMDLQGVGGVAWTRLIWLRTGTGGWLL